MIPEGVDAFGRRALVTSAPFVDYGDGPEMPHRAPSIGVEVAIVGEDWRGHLPVVDRENGDFWKLHRDCLTLVPPPVSVAPITPDVAAHVLWHYRQIGYPPGSFVSSLIKTIAGADPGNRRLLARGFPDYVRAVEMATEDLSGVDMLRRVLETRKPL